MGRNCKVYQQVTIGFNHDLKAPVIGDNVEVCCGAKVIGGITIGDNVLIGANSVVVKDVPSNCVVAGVPARIIKRLDHVRDLTL
jgi:serine O-acetyltransferase